MMSITVPYFEVFHYIFDLLQVHNKYTSEDFDEDLRSVLRRSGCKNEKIAFILDESNVLESGFLERMNTLLANGEVPGLFEGQSSSFKIIPFLSSPAVDFN